MFGDALAVITEGTIVGVLMDSARATLQSAINCGKVRDGFNFTCTIEGFPVYESVKICGADFSGGF